MKLVLNSKKIHQEAEDNLIKILRPALKKEFEYYLKEENNSLFFILTYEILALLNLFDDSESSWGVSKKNIGSYVYCTFPKDELERQLNSFPELVDVKTEETLKFLLRDLVKDIDEPNSLKNILEELAVYSTLKYLNTSIIK